MSAWTFMRARAFYIYCILLAYPLFTKGDGSNSTATLLTSAGLAVWVTAFLALNAVPDETRQRTLATVMVRPIATWEYLVGRALSLVGLLGSFVFVCLVLALALSGFGLGAAEYRQFVACAVQGIAWTFILVPLAGLLQPWPCAWLVMVAKVLNFAAGHLAAKSALWAGIKTLLHYGSISQINADDGWLWLATMVDNLAYAAVVFALCVGVYERRDVRLKES